MHAPGVGAEPHNVRVLLAVLAATSTAVASTPARSKKVALLADGLRQAAPDEVAAPSPSCPVSCCSAGPASAGPRCATCRPPADEPTLTVGEVDAAFADDRRAVRGGVAGPRVASCVDRAVRPARPSRSSGSCAAWSAGELRQGALGVAGDGRGGRRRRPARRRTCGRGDAARRGRARSRRPRSPTARPGWRGSGCEVGRPVQPMLAQTATVVAAALGRIGEAAVEWKLDGVRVQMHRWGDAAADVRVFTRTLDDITGRMPELVEAALRAARSARSCWTGRRSRCVPTGGRGRSSRPAAGSARASTSSGRERRLR